MFGLMLCFIFACVCKSYATCPNVPIEKLYPCVCLQDSGEMFCRGAEGQAIDDAVIEKIFNTVRESTGGNTINRITITQSELTKIDDKLFKGIKVEELTLRYNFRLRSVHKDAFADSRNTLKNISFGEVASFYETKAMPPITLDFLSGMQLSNVFLSGLNIGSLEESLFKPMVDRGVSLFMNALYFNCDCKMKWIFDKLDEKARRSFYGVLPMPMMRDANPISCRHEGLGALVPIRALSKADFNNC